MLGNAKGEFDTGLECYTKYAVDELMSSPTGHWKTWKSDYMNIRPTDN